MKRYFVVDAGPIVALIDESDQWNDAARKLFKTIPKPMLTCEVVIAECFYLLGESRRAQEVLLEQFSEGILSIEFSLANDLSMVQDLLRRYSDIPMSLADACLVRMSEIFDAPVFTFDSDFTIYRRNRRGMIPLVGIDNW